MKNSTRQNFDHVRVNRPERRQIEMRPYSLDQLLAQDHQARIVWAYVESLDLTSLYEKIRVRRDSAGQTAIAPEILVALWLLATLEGIGSARELDRRCARDIPYLWILGGVTVNYHTLSDFRVQNGEFLNSLLVDTVASLIDQGLVSLETIAQDGMRVRAGAGSSSFRRKKTLEQLQEEARKHLDGLLQESDSESERQAGDARRRAARERAAREREERIAEALRQREQLAKQREKRKKGEGETTRTSTTDPDARRMKTSNGGYNPAFNVQFATTADTRIIIAADVTNEGTDGGQLVPMYETICSNYGPANTPGHVQVDSAYATQEGVTHLESRKTKVVAGIPRRGQLEKNGKDPHAPQRRDTEEYKQFRARMAEESYREFYKQRPSIAEFPNADCRNRGLQQFNVRGLAKVKAVTLWHAIAFNFRRMLNLGVLST